MEYPEHKKMPPIFNGIGGESYFYFVHSFYVAPEDEGIIAATTDYGINFYLNGLEG